MQQAVINREIHFGLVVNPLPHPDLVIVETCEDAVDLFVAVPPGHDACGPAPCATESLDEAVALLRKGPLVFAGRVGQSHALIDRLAAQGWLPVRRLACGDLELVKSLTAGGLGVGILPRRVAGYGQRGRLMRLHAEMPSFPDTICLIYRPDLHRTRAAMRVKDARWWRTAARSGPPSTPRAPWPADPGGGGHCQSYSWHSHTPSAGFA